MATYSEYLPKNRPYEGIEVVLSTLTRNSVDVEVTDKDGYFQFSGIPQGIYLLQFYGGGYGPEDTKQITIVEDARNNDFYWVQATPRPIFLGNSPEETLDVQLMGIVDGQAFEVEDPYNVQMYWYDGVTYQAMGFLTPSPGFIAGDYFSTLTSVQVQPTLPIYPIRDFGMPNQRIYPPTVIYNLDLGTGLVVVLRAPFQVIGPKPGVDYSLDPDGGYSPGTFTIEPVIFYNGVEIANTDARLEYFEITTGDGITFSPSSGVATVDSEAYFTGTGSPTLLLYSLAGIFTPVPEDPGTAVSFNTFTSITLIPAPEDTILLYLSPQQFNIRQIQDGTSEPVDGTIRGRVIRGTSDVTNLFAFTDYEVLNSLDTDVSEDPEILGTPTLPTATPGNMSIDIEECSESVVLRLYATDVSIPNGIEVYGDVYFTMIPTGRTGPGLLYIGEYSEILDDWSNRPMNNGDLARDVVSHETFYWAYNGTDQATITAAGEPDELNLNWVKFDSFDFVAIKFLITQESYIRNTVNIGTNESSTGANIALYGGPSLPPYISVGQIFPGFTSPTNPGLNTEGIFLGIRQDGENLIPSFSMFNETLNTGLFWDGSELTIRGGIRQSPGGENYDDFRRMGVWAAGVNYIEGDLVQYDSGWGYETWQASSSHESASSDSETVGYPGAGPWELFSSTGGGREVFSIVADRQYFTRSAVNGEFLEQTISLRAVRPMMSGPVFWTCSDPAIKFYTDILGENEVTQGDLVYILREDWPGHPGTVGVPLELSAVQITARVGDETDSVKIHILEVSTSTYTVIVENESHIYPKNFNGAIPASALEAGTFKVRVYKGSEELTAIGTDPVLDSLNYRVEVSADDILFRASQIRDGVAVLEPRAVTADSGLVTITVKLPDLNQAVVYHSWSSSYATSVGNYTRAVTLETTADSFVRDLDGLSTPIAIDFTLKSSGVSFQSPITWTVSPENITFTEVGDRTIRITADQLAEDLDVWPFNPENYSATPFKVSAQIEDLEAEKWIYFFDEKSGVQVLQSNPFTTVQTIWDGSEENFTLTGNQLRAYEGQTQLEIKQISTGDVLTDISSSLLTESPTLVSSEAFEGWELEDETPIVVTPARVVGDTIASGVDPKFPAPHTVPSYISFSVNGKKHLINGPLDSDPDSWAKYRGAVKTVPAGNSVFSRIFAAFPNFGDAKLKLIIRNSTTGDILAESGTISKLGPYPLRTTKTEELSISWSNLSESTVSIRVEIWGKGNLWGGTLLQSGDWDPKVAIVFLQSNVADPTYSRILLNWAQGISQWSGAGVVDFSGSLPVFAKTSKLLVGEIGYVERTTTGTITAPEPTIIPETDPRLEVDPITVLGTEDASLLYHFKYLSTRFEVENIVATQQFKRIRQSRPGLGVIIDNPQPYVSRRISRDGGTTTTVYLPTSVTLTAAVIDTNPDGPLNPIVTWDGPSGFITVEDNELVFDADGYFETEAPDNPVQFTASYGTGSATTSIYLIDNLSPIPLAVINPETVTLPTSPDGTVLSFAGSITTCSVVVWNGVLTFSGGAEPTDPDTFGLTVSFITGSGTLEDLEIDGSSVVSSLSALTTDSARIRYRFKFYPDLGEDLITIDRFQNVSKLFQIQGPAGAGVIFRGAFSLSGLYYHTDERREVVRYSNSYWLTANEGLSGQVGSVWAAPSGGNANWVEMPFFSSVATDILFADNVYVNKVLNIGSSGINRVIQLNPDEGNSYANPYLSIGANNTGYSKEGIFLGYDSTVPKLSLVNSGNTKGLYWDGSDLIIKGAIRQDTSGSVVYDLRSRGAWASGTNYYIGDIVTYVASGKTQAWQCIVVHTSTISSTNGPPSAVSTRWVVFSESGSDGVDGVDGLTARTFSITASSLVFRDPGDGEPLLPASITLGVRRQNHTDSAVWTSEPIGVVNVTADEVVLTRAQFGSNSQVKIICTSGDLSDSLTITRVTDGSSTVNVVLSNPAHSFTADLGGVVTSYTGSGTNVFVYYGTELLTPAGVGEGYPTTPGTYNIYHYPSHLTYSGSPWSFADSISTLADVTAVGEVNNSPYTDIAIKIRRFDNTNHDVITVRQTFSKSKSGAPGTPGVNAKKLSLSASRLVFSEPSDSSTLSPSLITFTANTAYLTGGLTWTTTPSSVGSVGAGSTYTISNAQFGSNSSVTVRVTSASDSLFDEVTVVRVKDGVEAITAVQSNPTHTFTAGLNGDVVSYSGSGNQIQVYYGSTALTYNGTTAGYPAAGRFRLTATASSVGLGAITGSGTTTATVANVSSVTAGTDSPSISYQIRITNPKGENSLHTIVQSFSKSKQGIQGDLGPGPVYRGDWNSGTAYFGSSTRRDIVKHSGSYYYAIQNTTGHNPSSSPSYWAGFGATFSAVATDLLLAQQAAIHETLTIGTSTDGVNPLMILNPNKVGSYANPFLKIGNTGQGYDENGIFLGYSGGGPKMSIWNSGKTRGLKWDGSDLTVTGDINAISGSFSGSVSVGNFVTIGATASAPTPVSIVTKTLSSTIISGPVPAYTTSTVQQTYTIANAVTYPIGTSDSAVGNRNIVTVEYTLTRTDPDTIWHSVLQPFAQLRLIGYDGGGTAYVLATENLPSFSLDKSEPITGQFVYTNTSKQYPRFGLRITIVGEITYPPTSSVERNSYSVLTLAANLKAFSPSVVINTSGVFYRESSGSDLESVTSSTYYKAATTFGSVSAGTSAATNLGYTSSSTVGTITNTGGTSATIPLATGSISGLLSPSDFTKLSATLVNSVAGKTGAVTLVKADVGLGNVDNTADSAKPISTATQTALNGKENSFSKNTAFNKNFGTASGTVAQGNDSRILNGQTAFGWGNHASSGYAISGTGSSQVRTNSQLDSRYALLSHSHAAVNINSGTTGTLAINRGGTGSALTPTAKGVIFATSTSSYASTGQGTSSQFLKANGAADPAWASLGTLTFGGSTYNGTGNLTVTPALIGAATSSHTHSQLTFAISGGATPGTTYNGSTARTISYSTVGAAASSHTHPHTEITGLGSMATQNSSNVSITGGSISGIGGLDLGTVGEQILQAARGTYGVYFGVTSGGNLYFAPRVASAFKYDSELLYNRSADRWEFDTALRVSGRLGVGANPSGSYNLYVSGSAYSTGINYASDHQGTSDSRLKTILAAGSGRQFARYANLYKFYKKGTSGAQWGLLAQDMQKADKAIVGLGYDEDLGDVLTLSPLSLAGIALHGVKELDEDIAYLKKEVQRLTKILEANGIIE